MLRNLLDLSRMEAGVMEYAFEWHDLRELVRASGVAVLSVDYRLSPEHRFPAAFDDMLAAVRHAAREGQSLGIDATRLAVGGDSAGGNLALADVMAGQIQMYFTQVFLAAPQVKTGKLKALATGGARRSPLLPDTPTFIEAGFRDFTAASWSGLFVPAGTPPAVVQRLHAEFLTALRAPEVENRLRELGTDVLGTSPADFSAFLKREHETLGKLIRELRITAN